MEHAERSILEAMFFADPRGSLPGHLEDLERPDRPAHVVRMDLVCRVGVVLPQAPMEPCRVPLFRRPSMLVLDSLAQHGVDVARLYQTVEEGADVEPGSARQEDHPAPPVDHLGGRTRLLAEATGAVLFVGIDHVEEVMRDRQALLR